MHLRSLNLHILHRMAAKTPSLIRFSAKLDIVPAIERAHAAFRQRHTNLLADCHAIALAVASGTLNPKQPDFIIGHTTLLQLAQHRAQ